MLKEQNQALRSEILRQKAKDEAKALLTNAVEHQSEVLGPSSGVAGPLFVARRQPLGSELPHANSASPFFRRVGCVYLPGGLD